MKYSQKTMNVVLAFGMVQLLWALSIIVIAIVLCFTKSMALLKVMASLAVFMAFLDVGSFYTGTRAEINEDGEFDI